jgi:peptidoglycan/LPS O-acetylase OafA/YrhL
VDQGRTDSSRVPALDLLRLAAVGAVILYHYGFWGPASHGVPQVALPALAPVAQYGFLGVPVFFSISGFVIAYSAEGRTPIGFAIARFSRIYPTFVLCMTLTFVATLLFGAGHFEVTAAQWLANLSIAAPLVGQPYVDTSYWSLVIEVVFYTWVAAFMAVGLFPRRIDAIILVWLAITFANELTIDAPIFEKLFMADDSGFFAVGLLIYQHYRGRRDAKLWALSRWRLEPRCSRRSTSLNASACILTARSIPGWSPQFASCHSVPCFARRGSEAYRSRPRPCWPPAASPIRSICCTCSSDMWFSIRFVRRGTSLWSPAPSCSARSCSPTRSGVCSNDRRTALPKRS